MEGPKGDIEITFIPVKIFVIDLKIKKYRTALTYAFFVRLTAVITSGHISDVCDAVVST